MTWVDLLVYVLVLVPVGIAIKSELEMTYRPRPDAPASEWADGMGEDILRCRKEGGGTHEDRVRGASTYIARIINWRKALIAAVVGSILFGVCVWGRFPNAKELLLSVLTFGTVFFLVINYYHHHSHRHVGEAMADLADSMARDRAAAAAAADEADREESAGSKMCVQAKP